MNAISTENRTSSRPSVFSPSYAELTDTTDGPLLRGTRASGYIDSMVLAEQREASAGAAEA